MSNNTYMTTYQPEETWGSIAAPWLSYKQTTSDSMKDCTICWENCSEYIHCSNSNEHIICTKCSIHIVNDTYVLPNANIEIKWKCPLCRVDTIAGTWHFKPTNTTISVKKNQPIESRPVDAEIRQANTSEEIPPKFRWVKSLPWRNSVVNHFKAWIMYNSPDYNENGNLIPPSGALLRNLKELHNYRELQYETHAPWFRFLHRRHPDNINI